MAAVRPRATPQAAAGAENRRDRSDRRDQPGRCDRRNYRDRPGRLVLVLGGARSGKSAYVERQAAELSEAGRNDGDRTAATGPRPVTYIATATAGDADMADRIARHRQSRPSSWTTVEEPLEVARVLRELAGEGAIIILDCVTLLVSNLLGDAADTEAAATVAAAEAAIRDLVGAAVAAREMGCHVFIVSNEVGLGLVPPYPVGRLYRDTLGRANQTLAAVSDEVYLMVAGLPVEVRSLAAATGKGGC